MSKEAKQKTHKVDLRLVVRPRLDALFDQYASRELDNTRFQVELSALISGAGHRPVLDALLKRWETAPEPERDSLEAWIELFKRPEPIAYLWECAKDGKAAVEGRRASLRFLQALGEDAVPTQADTYAPPPAALRPVKGWPIDVQKPAPQARTPEEQAADEQWNKFESADPAGKVAVIEASLDTLDAYAAFEMVAQLRDELQPGQSAAARTQFAELMATLRRAAPALYTAHQSYYAECQLVDAVTEGRWDALRPLLVELCDEKSFDPDPFFHVTDLLMYHGQTSLLLDVLPTARRPLNNPEKVLPGVRGELDDLIMLLVLFNYASAAPEPRADDLALRAAVEPYGQFKPGWLESFLQHLATPTPWTPADFGDAVDAEQWEANLHGLMIEFMSDQFSQGIPFSRVQLAYPQWFEVLRKQMMSAPPARSPAMYKSNKKRRRAVAGSPLVLRRKLLDTASAELLDIFSPQAVKVGASFALLPAYMQFVARRGLLAQSDLEAALKDLKPLAEQTQAVMRSHTDDARLMEDLTAAWGDQHLAELARDPAISETVTVPSPAPPPKAQPGARLTYLFRVVYRRDPDIWRTVELLESQTLLDLHRAIQAAFNFDDDHLYSFYLSGRAWDKDAEYAARPKAGRRGVSEPISSLTLRPRQKFLYLFDYGDQHEFDLQLIGLDPNASKLDHYPRIVESNGKAPAQYGDYDGDEEDDEGSEDDEALE